MTTVWASERFQAFTPTHYLLIAIFVVGAIGLAALGRRQRGSAAEERTRRTLAIAIAVVAIPLSILQLLPDDFNLSTSLPIQLCDLAWMVSIYALWTKREWATALLYYWGLSLTIQAIITPSLGESFPHPRFFAFWALHFFVVWAAIYLTWGVGMRPNWRGYRLTLVITAVWAVLAYTVNLILDVNYGYLNRKPQSASILDLFGPWPIYVFVEIAILFVAWALVMTLPWVALDRRAATRTTYDSPSSRPS